MAFQETKDVTAPAKVSDTTQIPSWWPVIIYCSSLLFYKLLTILQNF